MIVAWTNSISLLVQKQLTGSALRANDLAKADLGLIALTSIEKDN